MTNTPEDSSTGISTTLNRLFDALASKRRRYLLYHLMDVGYADLDALTEKIVEQEIDCALEVAPDDVRNEIQSEIYHRHLPKLTPLYFIEYDPRSETVRYRTPSEQIEDHLESIRELEQA